jgi:hypothetical protein
MSSKTKPEEPLAPLLNGVNVDELSPKIAREIKSKFIDEDGFLTEPSAIVNDDANKNNEKRQKRSRSSKGRPVKAGASEPKIFQEISAKSRKIPGAAKRKNSPPQDKRVKCPLCEHKTEYAVLFVHIQMRHPEKNPKMVMAEFNRKFKGNQATTRYEEDMNELVNEYEKLKQGQDESRDGGKYLGHMRREQGKFGSLPLHDNYSDDADAK